MTIDMENGIIELHCNVDDMTGEAVAMTAELLTEAGAADVSWQLVGMKKGRPGFMLTVVCLAEKREEMIRLLFRHTSTIGIRETVCKRYVLRNETKITETPYGPVRVKHSHGYSVEKKKAEFEDLKRIVKEYGLTLHEIRAIAELDSALE